MTPVDPDGWVDAIAELRASGYDYLDVLTAVDRESEIEVVVHLLATTTGERQFVSTRVPAAAPELPTITEHLPAANWHERETAEMFGVAFTGHPDPRPLLLRSVPSEPPLRKATALAERVATPWPGAVDADAGRRARRRQLPPGVRESWLPEEPS